jgi:hypothetical protein
VNVKFLIVLSLSVLLPGISAATEEESEYGVLVNKPGVEETHAYCTACHSERIVSQQGLTRDGWTELLEWMGEEQEMEEIEEPDFTLILDYLSKNYNTDRPNFPRK